MGILENMSKEHQLREIICEAMCEIEGDFDDELTVGDIYKILAKYNDIDEIPSDVILDDEINFK